MNGGHHAARRDAVWREQPPYRGDLFQGAGAGLAHGGRTSIRGKRAGFPPPRARFERHALQSTNSRAGPMTVYIVHLPEGSATRLRQGLDRAVLVQGWLLWLAFLFALLWLLCNRLWLVLPGGVRARWWALASADGPCRRSGWAIGGHRVPAGFCCSASRLATCSAGALAPPRHASGRTWSAGVTRKTPNGVSSRAGFPACRRVAARAAAPPTHAVAIRRRDHPCSRSSACSRTPIGALR